MNCAIETGFCYFVNKWNVQLLSANEICVSLVPGNQRYEHNYTVIGTLLRASNS